MPAEEAKRAIVDWLGERGRGKPAISFRLRDWGFSRQRYWGCPIPIIYCDDHGAVPVPTTSCRSCCPTSRTTSRRDRAARAAEEDGCARRARSAARRRGARSRRWTPSSTRPGTSCATAIRTTTRRRGIARLVDWWCPVDQYIGGVDHATMHLIYARFFIKALNDLGLVGFREPFMRLFTTAGCSSAARRCRSRRAT